MTKPSDKSSSEGTPTEARPSVLIVDDDADILNMLRRYLGAKGFQVATTDAPFGVLEMLREHAPNVVVLDLMIPGLDGRALFGFIRSHTSAGIVFYSASSSSTLEALREEHPDALVVAKGGPLRDLEEAIRSLVR